MSHRNLAGVLALIGTLSVACGGPAVAQTELRDAAAKTRSAASFHVEARTVGGSAATTTISTLDFHAPSDFRLETFGDLSGEVIKIDGTVWESVPGRPSVFTSRGADPDPLDTTFVGFLDLIERKAEDVHRCDDDYCFNVAGDGGSEEISGRATVRQARLLMVELQQGDETSQAIRYVFSDFGGADPVMPPQPEQVVAEPGDVESCGPDGEMLPGQLICEP